jgi:osmoprotectant transport system permease protein
MLILLFGPVRLLGFSSVGAAPAVAALFLYSLLPIVRNTYAGLTGLPASIRESATALGLGFWDRLRLVELPLAGRVILAGVKTTAVINVGYATLGGLVGAGGYGDLIMQGLRRNSVERMLEGAIPSALLALAVKGVFELAERRLFRAPT